MYIILLCKENFVSIAGVCVHETIKILTDELT